MSLDKTMVQRVSQLARIEIAAAHLDNTAKELNNILDWIEQLNEVDTDGVEPVASVTGHALPQREDTVGDGGYPEKVLKNAPDRQLEFFAVPKVVE